MIKTEDKTNKIYVTFKEVGAFKCGDLVECEEITTKKADFIDGDRGFKIVKKLT